MKHNKTKAIKEDVSSAMIKHNNVKLHNFFQKAVLCTTKKHNISHDIPFNSAQLHDFFESMKKIKPGE